jgi:ribonuclease R
LQELGLSLGGGKEPKSLDYAKLLRSIQDRPDANVIQSVLLRSLSQAVYSPDNVGHFGLAYTEYCHFTSPIRRYPDLVIHRQIRMVLRGKWTEKLQEQSKTDEEKESLASLGDHTSLTERRADEATRDAVRWLKCVYIQKHVGDTFEGIISGVTRFGFFVELKDIYIDGLVHVTSLRGDYYYFDAVHHRLIGERSGIIYRLGDSVKVTVSRVAVHERKIDFDLADVPKGAKGAKGSKKLQKHKEKDKPFEKKEDRGQGAHKGRKGRRRRKGRKEHEGSQKPEGREGTVGRDSREGPKVNEERKGQEETRKATGKKRRKRRKRGKKSKDNSTGN